MKSFLLIFVFLGVLSCTNKPQEKVEIDAELFHSSMKQFTDVIVHDIFSPPVASRNYVYASIAAYECVSAGNPIYNTLAGQITGLSPTPKPSPDSKINYQLAATKAFFSIAKDVVFSVEKMQTFEDSVLLTIKKQLPLQTYNSSVEYGDLVAAHIRDWMKHDNYLETRTSPKFSVDFYEEWRWQPTPPAYMEAIEPNWETIRTLVIDSANQFQPVGHPDFSMDKNSDFYKELKEVYDVKKEMQAGGEQEQIAQFWDCNPYVSVQKGHFMFAKKKITPGGHWVNIVRVASTKDGADFDKSVFAYAKTTMALFDGFINCWYTKYETNLVRPETLINKHIDESWFPVLQTPPFPEYTSGHSVISTAAAYVLTDIFGDNFSFVDNTEQEFGLPIRSFPSFIAASQEAAISRLYGGIHYRSAIEHGVTQGKALALYQNQKLDMLSKDSLIAGN